MMGMRPAISALLVAATVISLRMGPLVSPALGDDLDAALGKALFERQWVAAPASTDAADGLGPLFNAKSCAACHQGGGGARLEQVKNNQVLRGAVIRLTDGTGSPHPVLGRQLQDQALANQRPEGSLRWTGSEMTFTLGGKALDAVPEVRIAPSLRLTRGIAAADETAIAALADPHDSDGDGISGRMRLTGAGVAGRFGLKAGHPTLERQIAEAFAFDLGLSSSYYPLPAGDCTPSQTTCTTAPHGESAALDGHELSGAMVRLVAEYLMSLRPRQRAAQPAAEALFRETGCAACHTPVLPDRRGKPVRIHSDLLLHDMGPENAGAVIEGDVAVTEWRTAPLVDLVTKDGTRRYMRDGRAATLEDAIMSHGGEAERARRNFISLPMDRKNELVRYLESL